MIWRINPEPELNVPSALQAKAGNKEFTLNWSKEVTLLDMK